MWLLSLCANVLDTSIQAVYDSMPGPSRRGVLCIRQAPLRCSTYGPFAILFLVQGLEKYLMTKIYHKAFSISNVDHERDEALSVRMTALNFIRPLHLDIPACFHDDKAWLLAMKELHKINSYKVNLCKIATAQGAHVQCTSLQEICYTRYNTSDAVLAFSRCKGLHSKIHSKDEADI